MASVVHSRHSISGNVLLPFASGPGAGVRGGKRRINWNTASSSAAADRKAGGVDWKRGRPLVLTSFLVTDTSCWVLATVTQLREPLPMKRTLPKVIWGYQVAVKLKPLSGEEGRKSHPSQKPQKGHNPPPTMNVETPHPILDPQSGKNLLWRWRTSGHASIRSLQDVSFTSVDCMLSRSLEKKWNLYNFLSKSKLSPHTVGSYPARELSGWGWEGLHDLAHGGLHTSSRLLECCCWCLVCFVLKFFTHFTYQLQSPPSTVCFVFSLFDPD